MTESCYTLDGREGCNAGEDAFLAELKTMLDSADVVCEPDQAAQMTVTVRRQWNDCRTIDVALRDLWDLHWRQVSGGVQQRLPRPFLHARMWCSCIPEGSDFPHSCLHGQS